MKYDFPVKLAPIKTDGILIPKKQSVVRMDTNEPIGIVSEKYQLIEHKTIINNFRKALHGEKFEEKIELLKNGAKLFATYKMSEHELNVQKGDIVSMQFIVKNSYDGSNSFQLSLGAFRLVCSNGMTIGKEFFKFSKKHIGGVYDADSIKSMIEELSSGFMSSLPVLKKMTGLKVNKTSEELFDSKLIGLPTYLLKEASDSYQNEKDESVWGYYNSLTYAITHKMRKPNPDANIYFSKRAWDVASSMI